jgi:hypothetical protein
MNLLKDACPESSLSVFVSCDTAGAGRPGCSRLKASPNPSKAQRLLPSVVVYEARLDQPPYATPESRGARRWPPSLVTASAQWLAPTAGACCSSPRCQAYGKSMS